MIVNGLSEKRSREGEIEGEKAPSGRHERQSLICGGTQWDRNELKVMSRCKTQRTEEDGVNYHTSTEVRR